MNSLVKKIIFVTGIIFILVFISFFFYQDTAKKRKNLSLINNGFYFSDIDKFVIKERSAPSYSDYDEDSVTAERDSEIIKIKTIYNLTKVQAEKYSLYQYLIFEGLFDQKLPPYPEFLTRLTGCNKEFLPILKKINYGSYYLTFADNRLNYGLCSRDLIQYNSGYGIFYCENSKRLYKIEYFIPTKSNDYVENSSINNFFESFKCL